jgi:hypothetical protein
VSCKVGSAISGIYERVVPVLDWALVAETCAHPTGDARTLDTAKTWTDHFGSQLAETEEAGGWD